MLVERIVPWRTRIDDALALPQEQRVHGDLHGANILVDDQDNVTGIVDLDKLPIAPRVYDLAYLLMFSIEWAYQQRESAAMIRAGAVFRARQVISGYTSVAPLSRTELDAIPPLAIQAAMGKINFFLAFQGTVRDTWIDTIRWITGHPETLMPEDSSVEPVRPDS